MMIGYVQNEGMLLDYDTLVAAQFGVKVPEFEYEKAIPINLNVTKGSGDWKNILGKLTKWYSKGSVEDRYDVSYFAVSPFPAHVVTLYLIEIIFGSIFDDVYRFPREYR